jgi:hypothetical protein
LKSYVGITIQTLYQRKQLHKHSSKNPRFYFHNAIRKDGWKNFLWFILAETEDIDYAYNVLEPYYIKLCKSFHTENGYNLTLGGKGTPGSIPSKEFHEKRREIAKKNAEKRSKRPPREILYNLYVNEHKSTYKLSKHFGVCRQTISVWLHFFDIPIDPFLYNQKVPIPEKFLLEKCYLNNKLSSTKIAQVFNTTHSTVLAWLRLYNIPRRTF